MSLPPLFCHQWPDFPLPSMNQKELVLQCLKTIQGTRDAGHRWYILLSGCLFELKMVWSYTNHGIFVWICNDEWCYLALATDDILFLSMQWPVDDSKRNTLPIFTYFITFGLYLYTYKWDSILLIQENLMLFWIWDLRKISLLLQFLQI